MATKIAHDAILAAIEDTSRDKEFGDAMDESGVFERDDYDTTKLDKMFEWNYRLSALQYLYESLLPSADLGGKVLRDWEQKQDGERKQC
ncbi:hypothetical protein BT96DRAFT_912494 [Gymnopus androsaceus JB14]|uniref:Uncharacterized protein n=1 Tax=Gymnopus androsaceus JB14 TaxID=1447944 RepID=A0A6A4INB2_9AGAR|nr:hypothetical protein BT96DRAFT_912494 [Gymnopus androsaceus JB14]